MGSVKTQEIAKTNTNVTWTYADHTVTATMQIGSMHVDEWRSIGFSLDQQMVFETVFPLRDRPILFFFINRVTNTYSYVKSRRREMRPFGECIRSSANDRQSFSFACSMLTFSVRNRPSATKNEVHVIRTAYVNGHTTCEFSFKTNSEQVTGEPAPLAIGKDYHLLFAAGHLATEGSFLHAQAI